MALRNWEGEIRSARAFNQANAAPGDSKGMSSPTVGQKLAPKQSLGAYCGSASLAERDERAYNLLNCPQVELQPVIPPILAFFLRIRP